MSKPEQVAKFAYGLTRGIVAAPSAVAFAYRREMYMIQSPGHEYETGEDEELRNFGHIAAGATGITLTLVSELSRSMDNYNFLPEPVVTALLITNGASFVFEVGRSIVNRFQHHSIEA